MKLPVWPIALLIGPGVLAVLAGRATARGRDIWLPAGAIWLGLAAAQHLALGPKPRLESLLYAIALLPPVAISALVARAEVRRGHTLWRAGSVAFMLGASVGAHAAARRLHRGRAGLRGDRRLPLSGATSGAVVAI